MKNSEIALKLTEARGLIREIKRLEKIKRKSEKHIKALEEAVAQYNGIYISLYDFLESIDDPEAKTIITAYYLKGHSWAYIGESLYMHRTTAEKKARKYIERGERENVQKLNNHTYKGNE